MKKLFIVLAIISPLTLISCSASIGIPSSATRTTTYSTTPVERTTVTTTPVRATTYTTY